MKVDTRLFVAQIVVAQEELWFAENDRQNVTRSETRYHISQSLFAANDKEHAYQAVCAWLESNAFSDANHDGPGDLTRYFAIGIHELEEVDSLNVLPERVRDPLYGMYLPSLSLDDRSDGKPVTKQKEDLEVFRPLRLRRRPGGLE